MAVAVSAFAMFGGALLSQGVGRGVESMSNRLGADILVVPHGYDKQFQAALLRGEPSTFYLKGDLVDKLRFFPGVERAAPQLFLATLNASCCTMPVQVIAYDPEADFVVKPWVSANAVPTPAGDEVVVGHMVGGETGTEISLFGRKFRIAARLDRTGMGFDTSVFMTMGSAKKLLRTAKNAAVKYEPGSVSSIMLAVAPGLNIKDVANAILREYAIDYDLEIVVSRSMISDIAKKLGGLSLLSRALAALSWICAAAALFIFFFLMLDERRREFGLFRILGAKRGKLAGIVLYESLLVSAAGGILGIAAALGLTAPFHRLITTALELPYLAIPAGSALVLGAGCLLSSVAVGPLSCLYSAIRIGSGDAYLTLRSGE
jgi:putative ABC transport system permease protein